MPDRESLQKDAKACAACGRTIELRKKWARDWENVRYCSDACRRHKTNGADAALEDAMLTPRGVGKTICPSELARALHPEDWAQWMERTRAAGRRLVERGEIVITQGGRIVDASRVRGAIRFRKE